MIACTGHASAHSRHFTHSLSGAEAARSCKSMPSDVYKRQQPTIALGFALHWTWVWVTFWSSTFYSISPAPGPATVGVPLEPLWLLSLLTNVLGYGALFVMSRKRPVFGRSSAVPLVAGALTLMGTLLVSPSAASFNEASSFAYLFGALITGVGSAVEVILWGELLTILGARQTIVYSMLATVIGSAFYLLLSFLPDQVARFLTVGLPAAEMWLFTRKQSIVRTARQPSDEVAGPDAPPSGRKPRLTTTRKALLLSLIHISGTWYSSAAWRASSMSVTTATVSDVGSLFDMSA